MFLETRNLYKSFGELVVINHLNLVVEEGEILGIAGPNGAGKSTLFNVITGFHRASGEIIFNNERVLGLKPYQICHKGIARTFQIPQLFLSLSVYRNVEVGAYFGTQGAPNEKQNIEETIGFLGLQGKEDIHSANINLYDKKLTMVAAALATKPKILLMDEPASGLSPTETTELMSLIRRINQEKGVTIIVIEHHMRVLTTLCNRLMILSHGEQIALGPPEEVTMQERVIQIYLGGSYNARGE